MHRNEWRIPHYPARNPRKYIHEQRSMHKAGAKEFSC
jgi:hypothetical protein